MLCYVILILLEAQSFVPFAVSKNMQKVQLTFSVRTIVAFIHCFKLQITALFIISTNRICQVQVDPNYMHFQLDADQLNGQQEDSESETDSDESYINWWRVALEGIAVERGLGCAWCEEQDGTLHFLMQNVKAVLAENGAVTRQRRPDGGAQAATRNFYE